MSRFREPLNILLECVVVLNHGFNFPQSHSALLELGILLVESQKILAAFAVIVISLIFNQYPLNINSGSDVAVAFIEPFVEQGGVVCCGV